MTGIVIPTAVIVVLLVVIGAIAVVYALRPAKPPATALDVAAGALGLFS